jgi:hypothetical protein
MTRSDEALLLRCLLCFQEGQELGRQLQEPLETRDMRHRLLVARDPLQAG